MIYIYNKDSEVVSKSKNLRGIRRAVGTFPVEFVRIYKAADGSGVMRVEFKKYVNTTMFSLLYPSYCVIPWGSFAVLCNSLRNWRNLYGVKLYVNGISQGLIGYDNAILFLGARKGWIFSRED